MDVTFYQKSIERETNRIPELEKSREIVLSSFVKEENPRSIAGVEDL